MEKSKLGLSIKVFGAIVFLCGLFGYIPLIICAGYILLAEESEKLKKYAIKAVVFVGILAIASALFFSLDRVFGILNVPLNGISNLMQNGFSFRFSYPLGLGTILPGAIYIIEKVGLCWFALQAYNGK